jgi:hypothetical protein
MKKLLLILPMVVLSCSKTDDLSCNCRKVYYERKATPVVNNGVLTIRIDYIKTGASEKATDCNNTTYQSMGGNYFFRIECN